LPTNIVGGVSTIYSTMQSMQGKFLIKKPKHKAQFPSNPKKFSPLASIAKMGRKLRRPI
jgi:hypothetical protein